ncbi:DNA repair protein RecN [Zhongshania sp. BJYM1]|uniref:DNA repair protein RecN n=1 Tax=Zhongshania aquatica TaxID=2965069 RepID=UPI0022B59B1D|nr:DNA repair protein RecN [Marortus sp. BJYM1]
MLSHLTISNYAITEHLDIELKGGMTVLTGETGAGKSIMLDALGLALGDRAESNIVRSGADRADIHALFDIGAIPPALKWLKERDLDDSNECMLRRVISADGRSRAYINGQPATLQDVRELGSYLIDIHSQHAHQSLLQKPYQRELLDAYAGTTALARQVSEHCQQYQHCSKTLLTLETNLAEQNAQEQLLRYQLEELHRLDLKAGELDELEDLQKQLANAEQILAANHHSLNLCRDGEVNAMGILHQALSSLYSSPHRSSVQENAAQLLESARIQIEEAAGELQHVIDGTELDPERLIEVESRLDTIYQTARKHRIQADELIALQTSLEEQLDGLSASDEKIDQLRSDQRQALKAYQTTSSDLSKKRAKAAKLMKQGVEEQLQALAMKHCEVEFAMHPLNDSEPHSNGQEEIEILISTNPAAPKGPLNKIASGGELSRISLAIQVITAKVAAIPTVIFDEIDVGIGGATAEIVGQLLKALGQRSQVLCVTHQPQVASQGDHHIKVQKTGNKTKMTTTLEPLGDNQKIEEIARMLGGIAITENTIAHAREMLGVRH